MSASDLFRVQKFFERGLFFFNKKEFYYIINNHSYYKCIK